MKADKKKIGVVSFKWSNKEGERGEKKGVI